MEHKAHPHAELMRLYVEDAAETDRPWERWEVYVGVVADWHPLSNHPAWTPEDQYRRKPRTRSLNGFEYPEPEVDAPEAGTLYWFPTLTDASGMVNYYRWWGDEFDLRMLRRGAVHLNSENARAHAHAIILAGGGEI